MIDRQSLECSEEFLAILIALDLREEGDQVERLLEIFKDSEFDWIKLLRLLLRHRVLVPFCDNLKTLKVWDRIPLRERLAFDEKVRQAQMRQLSGVGELIRISRLLSDIEIEFLCLKGPVLSQLLYKDPVKRHFSDLDFLVRQSDVCASIGVLRELGFRLSDLKNIESRSESDPLWSSLYHVQLTNDQIQVELHWRLSRNDRLSEIPVELLFSAKQPVSIGGDVLHTLGPLYLIEYLALHGTSHCWNRLKWLLDEMLLVNAGGSYFSGCGLSRPVQLMQSLRERIAGACSTRSAMSLISGLCIKQLLSDEEYPRALPNMLRRTLVLTCMASGLRKKFAYLGSLLVWPPVYEVLNLPRSLGFLYPMLGPMLWVREQFRLLLGRSGES